MSAPEQVIASIMRRTGCERNHEVPYCQQPGHGGQWTERGCAYIVDIVDLTWSLALQHAANRADSVGHHWSGAPAHGFFELAEELRGQG